MIDDNDPWNTKKNSNQFTNHSNELKLGKITKKFNQIFKLLENNQGFFLNKIRFLLIVIALLCIYICTGFYIVHPEEESVRLLFGKYHNTVGPGLQYYFPYPIGNVINIKVKVINKEEIGSNIHADSSTDHGEGVMLTGDENIVNINFDVQWRINNAYNYLFKVRDYRPGATVKNAAESAMREIIGKSTISFAIEGKGRASIAHETKTLLQNILNQYQMGIEILSIQLKKVDPPEKVISSFRDVQSARADKEKVINEAYAYRNEILPKAKGEAIKIKLDAEAYRSEVINKAEGDAKKFTAIHKEYINQPLAVKNRMYLETMEDILHKADKIVVSEDLNGMFSYLPLTNSVKK
ncbi:FtsH protease activity modulator HflK [Neoehrlichia mikurensis]|uniref:Protein HflK n=1 Tax=Neoehrlichia mikurensis TaxID=89586 RepID=A0A9Q9BVK6_9RICK|nr:FtsH protease activity modulator HflK [Neoehrlichia mikurensis]QXK91646.1 FtsH protease activity modulator HflK [Neoehrlichia mikurensis]QXK92857.1 FtsH protease activity modulator HflK [Neoehrlichia mikurensis]QXK93337.1 FtsH protease activity modulator HflK [Neoehrlichia mikurensis]UTO55721.1 FtsH protease activity modulator HflK [Neoehrlichia mikurensis]UTO56638.1 FtsH protease activity modulator HflK [Neoehrlichia mikurensis]